MGIGEVNGCESEVTPEGEPRIVRECEKGGREKGRGREAIRSLDGAYGRTLMEAGYGMDQWVGGGQVEGGGRYG